MTGISTRTWGRPIAGSETFADQPSYAPGQSSTAESEPAFMGGLIGTTMSLPNDQLQPLQSELTPLTEDKSVAHYPCAF